MAAGTALGPERGLERLDALEGAGMLASSSQIPAARADLLRQVASLGPVRA